MPLTPRVAVIGVTISGLMLAAAGVVCWLAFAGGEPGTTQGSATPSTPPTTIHAPKPPEPVAGQPKEPAIPLPQPPLNVDDKDLVCRVNGEPITIRAYEQALFWGDYPHVKESVLDFLIQSRMVRQELARQGVSVRPAEIDQFVADMDKYLRSMQKVSLADHLAARGSDMETFRGESELTIGLCRLAGADGRVFDEVRKPAVQARMNEVISGIKTSGKVETNPDALEAGVAAMVNGERISIEEAAQSARRSFDAKTKGRHLANIQAYLMVRQEFQRRKLELTNADLDYELELYCARQAATIGDRSISEGDVLKRLGEDPRLLRRRLDFQARAMLTRMVRDEIDQDTLKKVFNARFGDGLRKISHILLKSADAQGKPLPPDEDQKVRDKALALREKLVAGQDFAEAAGRFSDDRESAERGGNIGFIDRMQPGDPIVAAAYALKVGEISPPVRGLEGWHLLKLMEVKSVTFDEVRNKVRDQAITERIRGLMKELKDKSKVEAGPAMAVINQ